MASGRLISINTNIFTKRVNVLLLWVGQAWFEKSVIYFLSWWTISCWVREIERLISFKSHVTIYFYVEKSNTNAEYRYINLLFVKKTNFQRKYNFRIFKGVCGRKVENYVERFRQKTPAFTSLLTSLLAATSFLIKRTLSNLPLF